jgi:hypothetical protein
MRLYTNFYESQLAAPLTTESTTCVLSHHLPVISGGDYIVLSLKNSTGTKREIVHCTASDGEFGTVTIQRAKEGTIAQEWTINDCIVYAPNTAGIMSNIESLIADTSGAKPTLIPENPLAVTFDMAAYSRVLIEMPDTEGATTDISLQNMPLSGSVIGKHELYILFIEQFQSAKLRVHGEESILIMKDYFAWEKGIQPPVIYNTNWVRNKLIPEGYYLTAFGNKWISLNGGRMGFFEPNYPSNPDIGDTFIAGDITWEFVGSAADVGDETSHDNFNKLLVMITLHSIPNVGVFFGEYKEIGVPDEIGETDA